ncbi:hypothetical protein [Gemmata massiliana]|uniref:hypothetical protein n=1 Tax=Gemmata massiliana TaxID=1210884 RepID=UPI0013A69430|nr:hypothetical protein [Gemmata massiliana]
MLVLDRIVANNARVMRTANAQTRSSALFLILMGLVLSALGAWGYVSNNWGLLPFLVMGALFLVFGFIRLIAERYPSGN